MKGESSTYFMPILHPKVAFFIFIIALFPFLKPHRNNCDAEIKVYSTSCDKK